MTLLDLIITLLDIVLKLEQSVSTLVDPRSIRRHLHNSSSHLYVVEHNTCVTCFYVI